MRIYNVNTFLVARDEEKRKDTGCLPAQVSYSRKGAKHAEVFIDCIVITADTSSPAK